MTAIEILHILQTAVFFCVASRIRNDSLFHLALKLTLVLLGAYTAVLVARDLIAMGVLQ